MPWLIGMTSSGRVAAAGARRADGRQPANCLTSLWLNLRDVGVDFNPLLNTKIFGDRDLKLYIGNVDKTKTYCCNGGAGGPLTKVKQ